MKEGFTNLSPLHPYWRRQWQPTPVLLPGKPHGQRSLVGCSPWGFKESEMTEWLHITFHFHALEKEMATHSSVLAWRIPGMAEPGGLSSMGLHRVGHYWSDLAAAAALILPLRSSSVLVLRDTIWETFCLCQWPLLDPEAQTLQCYAMAILPWYQPGPKIF